MLSLQQEHPAANLAGITVDNFELVLGLAENIENSSQGAGKSGGVAGSPELVEEGEASSTDVILAPISQQVMVEDSRKRTRTQRSSATPPGGTARNNSSRAAATAAKNVPDSFAAFTSKYRDMLGDADAEEAEAVYSMVALTQAKAPNWSKSKQAAVVAAEVNDSRPAKRQQVAAAPACSEGGSSDSSAKSAPSPAPGAAAPAPNMHPGMMPGYAGMNHMQQQPTGDPAAAAAVANMLGCCSMPMAPGFFPGMGLMGMPAGPGLAGCPLPPFMPPWAVPPLMFPGMFGNMGMFGGVPPGSPPLMPMSGHSMLPGMPAMPPAFMSGVGGSCIGGSAAAGEPAAGFPVSGPVPAAGVGAAGAGRTAVGTTAAGKVPPAAATARAAPAKPGQQAQPAAGQQQTSQQKPQPAPVKQIQQQVKGEAAVGSPNSSVTAAAAGAGNGTAVEQHVGAAATTAGGPKTGAAATAVPAGGIHLELEQLDLAALRPWVLSHFCEDVYLLLLDVWRPDSPNVRDAVWAWKLHIKSHKPGCSQPDYRAFLVSLFGLEKLLQLTAAAKAGKTTGVVPCPAPLLPRAVAAHNAAGSGDSGGDNVTLVVAGSRMLSGLAPAGTVVGSATSPHVLGMTVQPQPA